MKEDTTLLEELINLVNTYLEKCTGLLPELDKLLESLEKAEELTTETKASSSTNDSEDWQAPDDFHYAPPSRHAHRVYLPEECQRLGKTCLGLLLHLEQTGMLKPAVREAVIDRAMELNNQIEIQQLKWIILYEFFKHSQSRLQSVVMERLIHQHSQDTKLPMH
ncbi:MAG: DUF494 family protein [Proteobacteria bacterium]|nr:DUF494 family protein [Pseudomonadota bacterium]